MQRTYEFINKKGRAAFLEIIRQDAEELESAGMRPERNLSVELDALPCLRFFPDVEHLVLKPGALNPSDLVYLKGLPVTSLKLDYYSDCVDEYTIDLSQFPQLQYVFSRSQYNFRNVQMCPSVVTLVVQEWYEKDLEWLRGSTLAALGILSGRLRSLHGVEALTQLRTLAVYHQRLLQDIQALEVCQDLESLALESCNRVDISRLPKLPNLLYLQIMGRQEIDNAGFFSRFPSLEYLFLDVCIRDGDLHALKSLPHCTIFTDRRHYSARNSELPKAGNKFHSRYIPEWLEILPEA